jgi:hypothetical protein
VACAAIDYTHVSNFLASRTPAVVYALREGLASLNVADPGAGLA